ncbi:transcriptional regulator [Streptococcus dysgalactiae subsp. dysgalactiae]|uniref:Transcriptional regulator n=1 Tax=Streptococcus dysgalactiae subsp. dysgalactiae TaxID=99822 RepID=A0A9X7RX77_STRDY|nr:transcriptional regulator [Streptococcus dysgalactiae subsp. dysgalactiae]
MLINKPTFRIYLNVMVTRTTDGMAKVRKQYNELIEAGYIRVIKYSEGKGVETYIFASDTKMNDLFWSHIEEEFYNRKNQQKLSTENE